MDKPTVGIFDFACCEGCQLQIVNMEEELLDLVSVINPVQWREGSSDKAERVDIAIVEGSITRAEDEEHAHDIRSRAGIVIAIGACATFGGVNKLKNNFDLAEVKQYVYGDSARMHHLNTQPTKGINEVIHVDYNIQGCPMNEKEFSYAVRCLAKGVEPVIPNHPVCVECKMRGNVCRYEYNEICLGPLTRAGCNAPCPTGGFWCFGCRGWVDNPNTDAARDIMDYYGLTVEQLKGKMRLFNSKQEHTDE